MRVTLEFDTDDIIDKMSSRDRVSFLQDELYALDIEDAIDVMSFAVSHMGKEDQKQVVAQLLLDADDVDDIVAEYIMELPDECKADFANMVERVSLMYKSKYGAGSKTPLDK